LAHEAEEDPAMSESTTDLRIVPLPEGQDVLTHILREGARRLLAQAVDAEVAAWIDAHAHLNADFRGGVTCLIGTQFLPEDPAISPGFVGS
jgi:hypothetical protein